MKPQIKRFYRLPDGSLTTNLKDFLEYDKDQ